MNSLYAELLLIRKRIAIWVLLAFWTLMSIGFGYIVPYYAYTSGIKFGHGHVTGFALLLTILPQNMLSVVTTFFPFFGGTIALILGVLVMGSEFSWGTLTTILTQRDSRLRVFLSKMGAMFIALIPFVLIVFALGTLASLLIAWREGQVIDMPGAIDIIKALGVCWFMMAVWAAFGVIIAMISRGTALAIGLGIIYALVVESVIAGFAADVDLFNTISAYFLRTNSYQLLSSLGLSLTGEGGPGGFSGPGVSSLHAYLVLAGYLVVFLAAAAGVLRRRDVAGAG